MPMRVFARVAACLVFAGLVVPAAPAAAQTVWTGTTQGSWSNAANWSAGVPNSSTDAYTGPAGANILLGASAQANSLFIEGPPTGASVLSSGTLAFTDKLSMNVSGTSTFLRILDAGSAPVVVTGSNVVLGTDVGKMGGIILDSQPGGSVTLTATDKIWVGYDGSGSYLSTEPEIPAAAGSIAISAGTIEISVLSTAGGTDDNYLGTYTTGATLQATNLYVGVEGQRGGAENVGGNWTVTNTILGVEASSTGNYVTVDAGGTVTNSGAFVVGNRGSNNTVYVGYPGYYSPDDGTLKITGNSDLVIGDSSTADGNSVEVSSLGTLQVNKNIVVGNNGHANSLSIDGGSVTSGGGRVGVAAGSGGNTVTVKNNGTWTTNGTMRVGSSGTGNTFEILSGGTVTLTGFGNNFFVGYEKSSGDNLLKISGTGSTLNVKATFADVVISATQGSGAIASGNTIEVSDGGFLNANRTLVGPEGTITGNGGTIGGNVLIGATGRIAPGAGGPSFIGGLSVLGNLDLSNGGSFDVTVTGTQTDFLTVGGTLALGGTSALALNMSSYEAFRPYVIATYGTLAGTFASITGLPADATIHYNYGGLNQIVLLAVPEIGTASAGTVLALLAGSLGLAERRRVRRRRGRPFP
jgi:T5SS/PEP-CTERM-associated repeat protein